MKLYTIDTGLFKLDGGAMFGVVPKTIWNKLNPADENNLCSWAMRCLLVESGNRLILIDNGIGNKQDDKFFGYYYLHGNDSLEKSLSNHGFTRFDITDVFLTHLHFDHCGGSVIWNNDKTGFELAFPNAHYWTHPKHWEHALNSNPREKASFLKDNIIPIQESGHLKFVNENEPIMDGFEFISVFGHTEAMMLPLIHHSKGSLLYMADLMPSIHHIPANYVMGYDIRPLQTMQEREDISKLAFDNNYTLFFEHDPIHECAQLIKTEKGYKAGSIFKLQEII